LTPATQPARALSWNAGWASFETGTWQPTDPNPPIDVDVLAVNQIHGVIAKGTKQATDFYVYDSGVPGPTVAVIGGMHGDEIAGWKAGLEIKDYWVKKGKLVIIPQINIVADRANKRTSAIGDLNRAFPRTKVGSPTNYFAKAVFTLMKQYKPDWLVDMHEGYSFHLINKKSVGQTVIYYPKPGAAPTAKDMAAAANKTITQASHKFTTLQYPIGGSLSRAVSIQLGTKGMEVETSDKQALSLRIKQHEAAILAMLTKLGMR
jgi:predicted deacylase